MPNQLLQILMDRFVQAQRQEKGRAHLRNIRAEDICISGIYGEAWH